MSKIDWVFFFAWFVLWTLQQYTKVDMCYHVMFTSYPIINTMWLSCDSHVTYPQLTVEVGAVGVTATNLEQNIIFLHSYQKPVSTPTLLCHLHVSNRGGHITRHCGHKRRANLCKVCDLPPTPFKSWFSEVKKTFYPGRIWHWSFWSMNLNIGHFDLLSEL